MMKGSGTRHALAVHAWNLRRLKRRVRFMRTCLHGVDTPYRFVESALLALRSLERKVVKKQRSYARKRKRLLLTPEEWDVGSGLPPARVGAHP